MTALLRWPTPSDEAPVPVVRVKKGLLGTRLIAPDVLTYAHRLAVEADAAGDKESDWVSHGGRRRRKRRMV